VLFDEGRVVIPLLSVTAAMASLGAIFFELSTAPAGHHFASLAFAAVTILLSWSFIQFIFAFHYAHEFYAHHRGKVGGLRFPDDEAPDYWDFLYFSFVIGMTSQVSDVCVASKSLRRTVTAHGLLSFIFNVTLLALAINLAASAIGNLGGSLVWREFRFSRTRHPHSASRIIGRSMVEADIRTGYLRRGAPR